MGVDIVYRGRMPKFNARGIAALIKATVPGAILKRVDKGTDLENKQFAQYSRRYIETLQRMGEDTKVDLRLSGGLMNSVKARETIIRDDSVEVVVAPDTGTSPVWKAGDSGKGKASKSKRTDKQGPPHNKLATWLHYGTARMKARPFMGLTEEEWNRLLKEIARIVWR